MVMTSSRARGGREPKLRGAEIRWISSPERKPSQFRPPELRFECSWTFSSSHAGAWEGRRGAVDLRSFAYGHKGTNGGAVDLRLIASSLRGGQWDAEERSYVDMGPYPNDRRRLGPPRDLLQEKRAPPKGLFSQASSLRDTSSYGLRILRDRSILIPS